MRRWVLILGVALSCGRTSPYDELAKTVPDRPGHMACPTGGLSGRLCAPDKATFINGATVSVSATDCNGVNVHIATTTDAQGGFELDGVPEGSWVVHAESGAFTQDTLEVFTAGKVNHIEDGGFCLAQRDVKIAVVTGTGDRIETLLNSLGLRATLFSGKNGEWSSHGGPFLSDLEQMKGFDLIFIDCAAASTGGYNIDLGDTSALIESNLHAYVQQGGSLYASDWGLVFAVYAAPDTFSFLTTTTDPVVSPLATTRLMGFAPQTVTAAVGDPGLAAFLGKSTVNITFPKQGSAVSTHWGLMESAAGATVLASADGVETCGDFNCSVPGATRDGVPLAVHLKLTSANLRGGNVVYTSFHNIAQTGDDVAKMLKYLILHL